MMNSDPVIDHKTGAPQKSELTAPGRLIAGGDVASELRVSTTGRPVFQARAVKGSGYTAREGEPFVRRAHPKPQGKAGRKAAKKARQQARDRAS